MGDLYDGEPGRERDLHRGGRLVKEEEEEERYQEVGEKHSWVPNVHCDEEDHSLVGESPGSRLQKSCPPRRPAQDHGSPSTQSYVLRTSTSYNSADEDDHFYVLSSSARRIIPTVVL